MSWSFWVFNIGIIEKIANILTWMPWKSCLAYWCRLHAKYCKSCLSLSPRLKTQLEHQHRLFILYLCRANLWLKIICLCAVLKRFQYVLVQIYFLFFLMNIVNRNYVWQNCHDMKFSDMDSDLCLLLTAQNQYTMINNQKCSKFTYHLWFISLQKQHKFKHEVFWQICLCVINNAFAFRLSQNMIFILQAVIVT